VLALMFWLASRSFGLLEKFELDGAKERAMQESMQD